jgi:4-amino-4-deoxy-L-arabinose transferase-like glycosyltransferase
MGLWLASVPTVRSDSASYLTMASQIAHWDFSGYTGARTPVYPLFILACGMNPGVITFVQGLLGIITTLMLFRIVLYRTGSWQSALVAGLLFDVSAIWLLYEGTIMSETLTLFLLMLSVWLFVRIYYHRNRALGTTVGLGMAVSLLALTRPLFLFLPPLLLVAIYLMMRPHGRWRHMFGYGLPVLVLVLGWCTFNKCTIGHFNVTSLTGYNLTQHAGADMELASPEYGELKSIYLKYRGQVVARTGSHSMTIWYAYPEMEATTGLSFSDLSSRLTAMSVDIFAAHPLLYFKSVARSWLLFWSASKSNSAAAHIQQSWLAGGIAMLLPLEKYPIILMNLCFFGIALSLAVRAVMRRGYRNWGFDATIVAIVLCGSVVQALMEYGENARYAIPFQPMILLVAVVTTWRLVYASKMHAMDYVAEEEVSRRRTKNVLSRRNAAKLV